MTRDIKFRHYFPSTGVVTAGHDVMTIILTSTGKEDFWKDAVWMQFTGLKDKNGKEIYEGDIVKMADWNIEPQFRDDDSHHRIYWDEKTGRWWDERLEDGDSLSGYQDNCIDWVVDGKVIGNIYSNPELLKP